MQDEEVHSGKFFGAATSASKKSFQNWENKETSVQTINHFSADRKSDLPTYKTVFNSIFVSDY